MTAHRCPPPWPVLSAPFAHEVLLVLDSATTTWCDPCRLRYIDMLTEWADRGSHCRQADHDALSFQLNESRALIARLRVQVQRGRDVARVLEATGTTSLVAQVGRYRSAWLSARRRAARERAKPDAYAAGHAAALQGLLDMLDQGANR